MTLLTEAMEQCVMLDRTTSDDGYGGWITTWTDGASFSCAIVLDTSIEARTAEQMGVKSLYTITTIKDKVLQYHDVIRRVRDGKIFRITSDGDDKATPRSAGLDMRQVTAEEWVLNGQSSSNK